MALEDIKKRQFSDILYEIFDFKIMNFEILAQKREITYTFILFLKFSCEFHLTI